MNAAASDLEIQTVKAFIRSAKRARVEELFSNRKRREKFIRGLAHFSDFEPRYIVSIPPSLQTPISIETLLLASGAPPLCHVISEWELWDGRDMPLAEALSAVIGKGMGALICCIPALLAFFENEDGRYILKHPNLKEPKS